MLSAQLVWEVAPIGVGFGTSWPTFAILQLAEAKGKLDGIAIEVTILDSPLTGYQMMAAGQLDVVDCTLDYAPIAATSNLPFALAGCWTFHMGPIKSSWPPVFHPPILRAGPLVPL